MTRWFISDLHLGDETLLKRRYSKSVEQMDSHLAARWDARVGKEDEVFVLGDVARGRTQEYLRDWFEARPGTKHLVLGNWDEHWDPEIWLGLGFCTVASAMFMKVGDEGVMLSHYPYRHTRNPEQSGTLVHGHTHQPKKVKRSKGGSLMLHVGWDAWRRMVSEDDLVALIEKERDGGLHDLRRTE